MQRLADPRAITFQEVNHTPLVLPSAAAEAWRGALLLLQRVLPDQYFANCSYQDCRTYAICSSVVLIGTVSCRRAAQLAVWWLLVKTWQGQATEFNFT